MRLPHLYVWTGRRWVVLTLLAAVALVALGLLFLLDWVLG